MVNGGSFRIRVRLVVAIAALLPLHWFEGTIERLRHRMEDAVTQVFAQSLGVTVLDYLSMAGARQVSLTH